MNLKQIATERAAEYVEDGMKVGLGTGSTAYYAICRIGERVRDGLKIQAVATSEASDKLAREWGIPIVPFDQIGRLDLTIDGADEVDPEFNLIKGGGALLREKIVAANSDKLIIVADGGKAVQKLGKFRFQLRWFHLLLSGPSRRSKNWGVNHSGGWMDSNVI